MKLPQRYALVGAVVGGIAAAFGESRNIIDVGIGAAIWAAIAFGIGTIVQNRRSKKS